MDPNYILKEFGDVLNLFEAVCWVGGFGLVIFAILRFRHGKNLGVGVGASVIASITIGIILINLPTLIGTLAYTVLFEDPCVTGSGNFIDYLKESNCKTEINILKPVVMFVQFFGFFAVIRGLFIVNRAHKVGMGGQSEELSVKGWVHVVAGFVCIYMVPMFEIVVTTFGLNEEMSDMIKMIK